MALKSIWFKKRLNKQESWEEADKKSHSTMTAHFKVYLSEELKFNYATESRAK